MLKKKIAKKILTSFKSTMNIKQINNLNFNGYKNIVSHQIKEANGDALSYVAMQLDNDKKQDLENWKDIQKNLFKKTDLKETIVFKTLKRYGTVEVFLDDFVLKPEILTKGTKEELLTLKALTLISSLTTRVQSEYFPKEDGGLYLSLVELMKNLTKFFSNQKLAEDLGNLAAFKKVKHHITAKTINTQIQEKMVKYFKL